MEARLHLRVPLVVAAVSLALIATTCANDLQSRTADGEGIASAIPVLSFGGIPDQDASRWARRYQVLADYLSERLRVEVRGVPAADYAAVVVAFKRGDIQLGWFGGLTGVQARIAAPGSRAIAQRPQDERFHSVFIVQASIEAEDLQYLKGLTFTFGSENSTSGHLMPRHFLLQSGVDPDADFQSLPNYSGSHDKTWKLVEIGAFQAGALNEAVWDRAVRDERVDLAKVRELGRTPPYFDYNWTVRPDLDERFGEGFTERLRSALLGVDDPEVLDIFNTDGFIETKNENYQAIEDVARQTGIVQ